MEKKESKVKKIAKLKAFGKEKNLNNEEIKGFPKDVDFKNFLGVAVDGLIRK